jgi:hypothetical protein
LPKVRAFKKIIGAGFPNNGLGLGFPATVKMLEAIGYLEAETESQLQTNKL